MTTGEFGQRNNVGGVKHSAHQGQAIAQAHGKAAGYRHHANAQQAEQGRADVVAVWPQLVHRPVQKRHDGAIGGGEESVFAGRGVGEAQRLAVIGPKKQQAQQQAAA